MKDKVFVDSNIFIYAKIKSQDAEKHIGAQSLLRSLDRQVIISVQVLNEFYNTLVRIGVDDATIPTPSTGRTAFPFPTRRKANPAI